MRRGPALLRRHPPWSVLKSCWLTGECPRQDSNLRTRLRRPLLYPLSYGGVSPCDVQNTTSSEGVSAYRVSGDREGGRRGGRRPPAGGGRGFRSGTHRWRRALISEGRAPPGRRGRTLPLREAVTPQPRPSSRASGAGPAGKRCPAARPGARVATPPEAPGRATPGSPLPAPAGSGPRPPPAPGHPGPGHRRPPPAPGHPRRRGPTRKHPPEPPARAHERPRTNPRPGSRTVRTVAQRVKRAGLRGRSGQNADAPRGARLGSPLCLACPVGSLWSMTAR